MKGNSSGNSKPYVKDKLGQVKETRKNSRFDLP